MFINSNPGQESEALQDIQHKKGISRKNRAPPKILELALLTGAGLCISGFVEHMLLSPSS